MYGAAFLKILSALAMCSLHSKTFVFAHVFYLTCNKNLCYKQMMSHMDKTALTLHLYGGAIDNMHQKLQQDRESHMKELTNAYMEAITGGMQHEYVTMLEHMIHDRAEYNNRKTHLDAAEWKEHESKVGRALGPNKRVLTGGAVQHRGKDVHANMEYSGNRYNAYLYNLHRKLAHDRSIHTQELQNVQQQAAVVAPGSAYTAMMGKMLQDRQTHNERKTMLDASQWQNVEKHVIKGGNTHMLRAGAKSKKKCRK